MKTLLFKNNIHNTEPVEIPGEKNPRAVNLTVRKGLKWSNLKVSETVWLQETPVDPTKPTIAEAAKAQQATIYDVKIMSFADLVNYRKMLKLEHDPKCRNYPGLFETMRNVYDGFLQHELVTLVFYEVNQEDQKCPHCDPSI